MTSHDFAANLYLDHQIGPQTAEQLRRWSEVVAEEPSLPPIRWHMRVDTFIRHAAIGASARIEGNPLSLEDADALLEGLPVEGPEVARREILNYRDALDLASTFAQTPEFEWNEMIIRGIQASVLRGLDDDSQGRYRMEPVAVGNAYTAPHHDQLPALMRCFVGWLQASDWHPLVRTALLHLNLVAIHPWMNGNGRTARILSSLELMRYVRAPELISIEPAILRRQGEYFRLIREALGPTHSPDRHSATEWVAWYVNLHAERLASGQRFRDAMIYDIGTVVAALERAGDPLEWGPVVALAGFGPHVFTRTIAGVYGKSPGWARALAAQMTRAGWLEPKGRTSGRYYVPTEQVLKLHLRTRELREREASAETLGLDV